MAMHEPRNMKYPNPSETGFPNSIESKDALAYYSNPFGALSQIIPSTIMSQRTRCHRRHMKYQAIDNAKLATLFKSGGSTCRAAPVREKIQVRPCNTFFPNTTVNSNLKQQINIHNNGAKNGAMFFSYCHSSQVDWITNQIKHKLRQNFTPV